MLSRRPVLSLKAYLVPVLAFLLLTIGAAATYAGDKPLATVYQGELAGNYTFTTGTSGYTSSLVPGSRCNASFTFTLPEKSIPTFSRLYVYWAWSRINQKAVYPVFTVHDTRLQEAPLNLSARYVDSKGFVSNYDFYSGMDAYELTGISPGQNTITIDVDQDGPDGSSVLVFGMAALVVFGSDQEPSRMIWVKEGCDLMFSSYGISPEMASSAMVFSGEVQKAAVGEARLFLVAPSGGYSRDLAIDINKLLVNRLEEGKTPPLVSTVFSLLFPNYRGKEWSDIFDLDPATQIGFETKDIRAYLRTEENRVVVRDQGDYLQLSNAILSITERKGDTA
jgi:hypothetical protein